MTAMARRTTTIFSNSLGPRAMKITVQHKNGELAFDCGERESILYAGLRQGINLPFECATGTCGTCRARVTSGDLDIQWKEAPGRAAQARNGRHSHVPGESALALPVARAIRARDQRQRRPGAPPRGHS